MAKMLFFDNLKELRTIIDQQHLLYLEFDENPQKIDQRTKLEGYIKEYLCLAPHNMKFTFQETAEVLHLSASSKSNFTAYKAAAAWKAIGKYADNLISHPWRKEYRNVKLYCGFYKHEIEGILAGAEQMFEVMGYKNSGQSSLILYGILDPDRITSVSKDAILAYVECQIMKQIWESLSIYFNISWLEVLEFRENHIGTPDQVINSIIHKYTQRQYQEKFYHRPIHSLDNHLPQPECLYKHNSVNYLTHMSYPAHTAYPIPFQSCFNPTIPLQALQYNSSLHSPTTHTNYISTTNILKPHQIYPTNEHHKNSNYLTQLNSPIQNHYNHEIDSPIYPAPSVVPTGQLIEFDLAPSYSESDPNHFYKTKSSKHSYLLDESLCDQSILKSNDNEASTREKAKYDGVGSWENWDYVYRNLELQGYKKSNEHTREISLKENHQSLSNGIEVDKNSLNLTELSDRVRKINLDWKAEAQGSLKKDYSLVEDQIGNYKDKMVKEKVKHDIETSGEQPKLKMPTKPMKASVEKGIKETEKNSCESASFTSGLQTKMNTKQKKENETRSSSKENTKEKNLRESIKPLTVDFNDEEKWQCATCTYLNSMTTNVCEMCYKSKDRGNEVKPQPSGGRECYQCTLVNKPGLNFCSACNAYLKDSPTYI